MEYQSLLHKKLKAGGFIFTAETTPPDASNKEAMANYVNTMSRYASIKEQEAQKAKDEILLLWTDFFKPEHLGDNPDLHDTFWKAAKLCSACKVELSLDHANELLDAVKNIHHIFWGVKRRDIPWFTASQTSLKTFRASIVGNSMSPEYNDGDVLNFYEVNSTTKINIGDLVYNNELNQWTSNNQTFYDANSNLWYTTNVNQNVNTGDAIYNSETNIWELPFDDGVNWYNQINNVDTGSAAYNQELGIWEFDEGYDSNLDVWFHDIDNDNTYDPGEPGVNMNGFIYADGLELRGYVSSSDNLLQLRSSIL